MLNQAAVDELYAATYLENYLDCVENLPDDLQRHLTRIRELEISYHAHMREAEQQGDAMVRRGHDSHVLKRALMRATQALIAAQEVADEKMHEVQQIQDLLENKTRQLDLDYTNLDTDKEQETRIEPTGKENLPAPPVSTSVAVAVAVVGGGERQSKRQRRSRVETVSTSDPPVLELPQPCEPVTPLPRISATATAAHSQKKSTATTSGKKKKRKAVRQQHREENPPLEEEVAIDPDEPTYCLCDQISYGEMILCDNDLCPIEWFHFSCVALATKPKGKWFCPKCRGDRPNVMKPKAQFLKELERYNKEKEEKG